MHPYVALTHTCDSPSQTAVLTDKESYMKRRDMLKMVPMMLPAFGGKAMADGDRGYDYPIDTLELSHPRRSPEDFQREPLANQYIGKIRDRLLWIRETQSDNLLEASYAIAETVQSGGTSGIHGIWGTALISI